MQNSLPNKPIFFNCLLFLKHIEFLKNEISFYPFENNDKPYFS